MLDSTLLSSKTVQTFTTDSQEEKTVLFITESPSPRTLGLSGDSLFFKPMQKITFLETGKIEINYKTKQAELHIVLEPMEHKEAIELMRNLIKILPHELERTT